MNDRILKLIDSKVLEKIKHSSILLIGLGGVGGYTFESLVRNGFTNITVVDMDIFEESNLNRQILATQKSIGQKKTKEALLRAKQINPLCNIKCLYQKLEEKDITEAFLAPFDYIVDACDTVSVKLSLIRLCTKSKKKLISCMGSANRIHAEMFEIIKLKHTKNDPLAKILRSQLKKEEKCLNTFVVCSREVPKKQKDLGSLCHVVMSAGACLSSFVINDILSSLNENKI